MKTWIVKLYSRWQAMDFRRKSDYFLENQIKLLQQLIKNNKHTQFGKDHSFSKIKTYEDFKNAVPIRKYEDFSVYIESLISGKETVLSLKKPKYLVKTSGTTNGPKLLPLVSSHMSLLVKTAQSLIFNYIALSGDTEILGGDGIYFQGSPRLENINGFLSGRLSGITAHHVPRFFQKRKIPSFAVNCLEDWDKKIDLILQECQGRDVRLIAGVPPWILTFFRRAEQLHQKPLRQIFPNLKYYIQGGASFAPYEKVFQSYFPDQSLVRLESFASSEGFIGFRFDPQANSFFLNPYSGIFFEFIPEADYLKGQTQGRCSVEKIQLQVPYVVVLSSISGLWAYVSGDVIKFVGEKPYRFQFLHRLGQSLSVFGEHVHEVELENAIHQALDLSQSTMIDFYVTAEIEKDEKPFYQWHIEFNRTPADLRQFASFLDKFLAAQNTYFANLIHHRHIGESQILACPAGTIYDENKSNDRYGGQTKFTHLKSSRLEV